MTVLQELAASLARAAAYLEGTGHPFDRAWAKHLLIDAKAMRMLASTDRHLNSRSSEPAEVAGRP